ncbi:MAG: hypothetical protein IJV37_08470 [Bacteroidales bacterium]|nr:hypothetical protein [Bacteroidales bacterium]
MKKYLFSLLALLALPLLLHANGDPVISYSAAIRSCNPVPLKVSDVQVVREDLNIKVKLPYTEVRVAYRLKNASAGPIHVDYGFPIDFDGDMADEAGFDKGGEYESLHERGLKGRAVRDVHFRLDGKELPWTRSDSIVKTDSYEDEDGRTVDIEVCRLWTYTVLDIPAGATVSLEVDYSVLNGWSTGYGMLNGSPLSRYFPSDVEFYYDFTPAKHWGNGKAGEIAVTVDCSAMPAGYFHPEGPDSPDFYGADFVRSGKVWTFQARNYDFAAANGLALSFYRNYSDAEGLYPSWGDPLTNCAVPASDYRLSVSGAQDKYPASNMQDGDPATAWVAPGNGVGSVVEIVFPEPRRVSDIAIWNGYHKSASLWTANSRIKRMRMEVTRADGFKEAPVEMDFSDWDGIHYALSEEYNARFGRPTMVLVTSLDRDLYGRELGSDENGIIRYDKVSADAEKVSGIRLTVLEVVPGTKYKDLCVSDIVVLDGFTILDR